MKLHEIIAANESGTTGILIELLVPYKKSLYTYFKRDFNCEPVLIVTCVCNAVQYGFIAPSEEMNDAIDAYLDADNSLSEEDKENERELISSQSIMLNSL